MHSYNWKYFPITQEEIEKIEQLYGDKGRPIMEYGYPFFEQDPSIEANEATENDKDENIIVDEEITIQQKYKIIKMEIEEGNEANDDVNEE